MLVAGGLSTFDKEVTVSNDGGTSIMFKKKEGSRM
jgi:hypothetical protein